ncbi:uncharacterized protein [Polyergus mexicanus]|uniref:uncharacterized protein n=1 Tax=Polyergus mexicanus TaxID=615972 RepID=UPI0038B573B1
MGEELENQRRLEMESGELLSELQLLFTLKPGMDRRRYNAQRNNEVADVFYTNSDGEIPESYVTIRNKNTKTLQKVSIMDPNVEPWIYPLFYPYGTQEWHRHLTKLNSNRRITREQYIKYRMAIRNEFNAFILGRRLFQQWLVDSYVKIEKDRIDYCKNHQKELRTETYQGLKDYIETMANNLNGRIRKMIILPSTFTGSPRNMLQNYQDAMAIVIMKHMIHGPCGDWCLVDGRCSKHYPKSFLEETRMDEDAYPYYRRRDNGHDVAAITIEPITENVIIDHDEIHNNFEARYVGPVEAIKGATSFNDLRTVNGEFCQSFLAACLALGLIEDDDEWKRAMNEAVGWMMPRQLRRLFIRQNKAYAQINSMLRAEGKSLADYPQMEQLIKNSGEEDYMTLEETMEIGTKQYKQLNDKQKEIVDLLLNRLDNNNNHNNHCFYIDGPGGSATLLPTGKTVHKTFGLSVPLFADSSSAIKIHSKEAQYLKVD